MRKGLLLTILILAGCSAPPKPEVSMAQVAGDYRGYVDATIGEAPQIDMALMRTVEFLKITIKPDGTYRVVVDDKRKKNNGKMLDEGTIEIQGKSILFKPKVELDPLHNIDQSFTTKGGVKIEPFTERKYVYTFPSEDRIILYRT